MLYGCDISHWQGDLFDFTDYDFVIAKASEGVTYTDPCFQLNMERALRDKKLIGAYHYARPENNSAKDEALNFVKTVKPYVGKCLLALDWEATALKYPVEWALEWLLEVERLTGVVPLIYCSESYVKNLGIIAENGNGLWCAKWGDDKPKYNPFNVLAIWQYTSNPHDKDVFYGDERAWSLYCTPSRKAEEVHECQFCKDFDKFLQEHGYVKR